MRFADVERNYLKLLFIWVVLWLVVIVSLPVQSSPVTVGINSKVKPGTLATCQAIVDGVNPLGTGVFGDLVTGAVVADLRDSASSTTVVTLDATNIPADLCTVEGVAVTAATTACTNAYTMTNLKPVVSGDGTIMGFIWNCMQLNDVNNPFWVYAECP